MTPDVIDMMDVVQLLLLHTNYFFIILEETGKLIKSIIYDVTRLKELNYDDTAGIHCCVIKNCRNYDCGLLIVF